MSTNPLLNRGITVVVIALLLALAFVPISHAAVSKDTTIITCKFFTLEGIKEVEKEVAIKDAERLSQLMHGRASNNDAIVSELSRLELLSETISEKLARELISGEYGRKLFEKIQEKWETISFDGSNAKRNLFCNVSGDAVDSELLTPLLWFSVALFIFSGLALMLLDMFLFSIIFEYLWPGPLWDLGTAIAVIGLWISAVFTFKSFKVMPFSFAILEDATLPPYKCANVNTSGLLGEWWMHNCYIGLKMMGFFGLWIVYDDGMNDLACDFRGFSLYVKATGYDG